MSFPHQKHICGPRHIMFIWPLKVYFHFIKTSTLHVQTHGFIFSSGLLVFPFNIIVQKKSNTVLARIRNKQYVTKKLENTLFPVLNLRIFILFPLSNGILLCLSKFYRLPKEDRQLQKTVSYLYVHWFSISTSYFKFPPTLSVPLL